MAKEKYRSKDLSNFSLDFSELQKELTPQENLKYS